ncbi:MAG: Uncharacterised protein [Cyanobium sp. ARS6]|nr:MAG: Uncharacterised protein [Cyanobium sp. ARS6]
MLCRDHASELTIRFARTDLQLQISLFEALKALIQAARNPDSPRTQRPHLTAEFVEQIIGAGSTGSHEGQQIGLGDPHQAKAGIKTATDTLKGRQCTHHEDQLNRQPERLAVDKVVEIAGQFVDHRGTERWSECVAQHQTNQTPYRTQIHV